MKNLYILLFTLLITACAPQTFNHGHVLTDNMLGRIQEGTSTKTDVLRALGSPASQGTLDNNTWIYTNIAKTKDTLEQPELNTMETLVLKFNDENRLISKQKVTQNDTPDAEPLAKKTKTHGQSLGVVDQLLDNIGVGF